MSRLTLKAAAASLLPLYIAAHFSHHVVTAVTTPLLPLIRTDFGLSYTQALSLSSAFTLAYGVGHLFSGWMMVRLGTRAMITTGIAGVALCGLAIGLAPGYGAMMALQFVMGIAGSGYHPAATTLISRSVPSENRGEALGIHIIGGSASNFVTPALAGLFGALWGWRQGFVVLALPTIAIGVAIFVQLGRRSPTATPATGGSTVAADGGDARWATIVPLLALSCLGAALIGSAIAILPLLATDSLKVTAATAAVVVAVVNMPGIFVSPVAGWLSDRLGRIPLLLAVTLATAVTVTLVARVPHGALFYVLVLLLGSYVFVRMPLSESFILGEVPARHRPNVLGFYYFASSAFSAVVNPFVGRITDLHGFQASFAAVGCALAAVTLACAAAFWLVRRTRPAGTPAAR